jgi:ribosomal protein L17
MRHRVKTKKFKYGKDANQMLLRKLLVNFAQRGKLTTTEHKAKFLKQHIETMVQHLKKDTQASRTVLEKRLGDKKLVMRFTKELKPAFQDRISGFVKTTRLPFRQTDGVRMMRAGRVFQFTLFLQIIWFKFNTFRFKTYLPGCESQKILHEKKN